MRTFFCTVWTHTLPNTHTHTHYAIPSVTSEQWHITRALVFRFFTQSSSRTPQSATHVMLTCHPCQLHFNTSGRRWAENQQSSWQTASSDPTFTANLPVKGCDTPAKYWDNVKTTLLTWQMYSSCRQWCRGITRAQVNWSFGINVKRQKC